MKSNDSRVDSFQGNISLPSQLRILSLWRDWGASKWIGEIFQDASVALVQTEHSGVCKCIGMCDQLVVRFTNHVGDVPFVDVERRRSDYVWWMWGVVPVRCRQFPVVDVIHNLRCALLRVDHVAAESC